MNIAKEEMVWLVPVGVHVEILRLLAAGEITREGARVLLDYHWQWGLRLATEAGVVWT